jgi:hypothetical protein
VVVNSYDATVPTISVAFLSQNFPCLSFGMASRWDCETALEKAYDEACASYAFAITQRGSRAPRTATRPIDHAATYWHPEPFGAIGDFFTGAIAREPTIDQAEFEKLRQSTLFFELTSDPGPMIVVRAINDALRPIWFGELWAPAGARPRHFFP